MFQQSFALRKLSVADGTVVEMCSLWVLSLQPASKFTLNVQEVVVSALATVIALKVGFAHGAACGW